MLTQHITLPNREPEGLLRVLGLLVKGAREHLGDHYVGTYLQGSQATGAFDDHSDVDFFVVVKEDLSEQLIDSLSEFHTKLFEYPCYWARHLEGSYISLGTLKTLPPPRLEIPFLNHGGKNLKMSDHDHYLAVLWLFREKGVLLDGPDPKDLVPIISKKAVSAETRDTMEDWANQILSDPSQMTERWYQAFAVLNYCRMAFTFATGEVGSKREGVDWAKSQMDSRWHSLMDDAFIERRHPVEELIGPSDPELLEKTKDFIRYVLSFSTRGLIV